MRPHVNIDSNLIATKYILNHMASTLSKDPTGGLFSSLKGGGLTHRQRPHGIIAWIVTAKRKQRPRKMSSCVISVLKLRLVALTKIHKP